MRPHEVELRVLQVVERVEAGQQNEDSLVELKAEWPADHREAARRIAGHANAARGSEILWVIGVDQDRGVVGAPTEDLANWWPQVCSWFDGEPPELEHDLVVHVDDQVVVALAMTTGQAPYVVRNPGKGPEREVPWRHGTRIRAAQRQDLIRILSPVRSRPSFEVLGAALRLVVSGERAYWELETVLYMDRPLDNEAVIPFHRSRVTARLPWIDVELGDLDLRVQMRGDEWTSFPSRRSGQTRLVMPEPKGQVTISQPTRVHVVATLDVPPAAAEEAAKASDVEARLELHVVELESPVVVRIDLEGPAREVTREGRGDEYFSLRWVPPRLPPVDDFIY